jgi:hypothetical protein
MKRHGDSAEGDNRASGRSSTLVLLAGPRRKILSPAVSLGTLLPRSALYIFTSLICTTGWMFV